jgi:hypothetical protein
MLIDVPIFLRKKQQDQREPLGKIKFKKFQHYLTNEETIDEVQEVQPDDHTLLYMNKGQPKGLGKGKGKGKKGNKGGKEGWLQVENTEIPASL